MVASDVDRFARSKMAYAGSSADSWSRLGREAIGLVLFWIERHRQRRALVRMSDEMLKDIGISRSDAFQEWSKSFWEG